MKGMPCRCASAALVIAAGGAWLPVSAQLVARATYSEAGSFEIPAAGLQSPREPTALAVDSAGYLHVVDREGGVFVFGPDGTPRTTYGSEHLSGPVAIAFDDRNAAYVVDSDAHNVRVFDAGTLWYTIGGADGPARLGSPVDVAIGPGGFVHVLDEAGPAIRVFSRDGVFIRAIELGSQLGEAVALAIDGDGTLLIASATVPDRVYTLPSFSALPWTGATAPGTLRFGATGKLVSVASDRRGTIVALDADDGRLWGGQRVEPDETSLDRPIYGGLGSGRGSFRAPVDVAFAGGRDLLILDRELRKVERIELSDSEPTADLAFDFPVRVSDLPSDLDRAVLGVAGRADGSTHMVIGWNEGRSILVAAGVEGRFTDFFGRSFRAFTLPEQLPQDGSFGTTLQNAARDVAFNDTLLVIVEESEDRFTVYDRRDGSSLGSYGDEYGDDRRLRGPTGVAIFSDGSIVVADHGNDRVAVFSADLATLLGDFSFLAVEGVAVSPSDRLFAWDETGQRLAEIPLDGTPIREVEASLVPGPVRDLDFDAAGNLFLLERGTSRVSVVSAALDRVFVRFGGRDPELEAAHVSTDAAGNVYVASLDLERTHVYRWDLDLPALADVTLTLTSGGASAMWQPIDSPFLDGYRVLGANAPDGDYRVIASTRSSSASFDVAHGDGIRWVRVAPMTIAGALADGSEPLPLRHLDLRAAAADGEAGLVVGNMRDIERLVQEGSVRVGDDVAQELQWLALDAEVELGYLQEAVARGPALEGWTGDDGGLRLNERLARAYAELGIHEEAYDHAVKALERMPAADRSAEEGFELLSLAVAAAAATGHHEAVITLGEELLPNVAPEEEYRLIAHVAEAHLQTRHGEIALRMADGLLQRDLAGEVRPSADARTDLGWTGVRAAIGVGDSTAVERWRAQAGASLSGERLARFHVLMGGFWLEQDDPDAARASLDALAATSDPAVLQEPATIDLSLGIYRALQEADVGTGEAGLRFLTEYADALPPDAERLEAMYRDSLAVFAVREETRAKLRPGLTAWAAANFVDLIRFFETLLTDGGLTVEQEVLSRALLASAYADVGQTGAARESLEAILRLDPAYDAQAANVEAEALFGVHPFSPALVQLLQELQTGDPPRS